MTEIDALKYELEQERKAFDKLHKTHMELISEYRELKDENKELKEELDYYKNQCIDEDIKYLRENTVWEQIPSKIRTHTKTSIRDDLND